MTPVNITFGKCYYDSNGIPHQTIEEAQGVEITALLEHAGPTEGAARLSLEGIVKAIVDNKAEILNILTLTDSSRPRARGVKRGPRKPKVAVDATKAA